MEAVLSIAGSDSSGGAGIQADIKTIAAHRLFAETAITALTAQNTLGVTGVLDVDPAFVAKQIDAVFEDIRPAAVKVGMVSSAAIIEAVADALERHAAANIVVDPVMVATSGARLIGDDAIEALKARLLPLADVVTPNMPEAAVLAGFEVVDETSMERAALRLAEAGAGAALVKGGHRHDRADDVLVTAEGDVVWLRAPRVDTENTHGTGCTLSSAIACGLAQGRSVEEAVRSAKGYVAAPCRRPQPGKGKRPPRPHVGVLGSGGLPAAGTCRCCGRPWHPISRRAGARVPRYAYTLAIPTISGTMAALADLLRRPARPFRA